jgi:hypothetical protein
VIGSLLSCFFFFTEALGAARATRFIAADYTLSARVQDTFNSRWPLITILNGSKIRGMTSSVQNLKEMQIKQIARNN